MPRQEQRLKGKYVRMISRPDLAYRTARPGALESGAYLFFSPSRSLYVRTFSLAP